MRKKDKAVMKWYLLAGVFALIGIASFIVGYGLKDGWDSVIAWFTSKWAVWVYVFAVVYVFVALGYVFWKKNKEMIDGE